MGTMSDPGPRLLRWRLIERLVELAAPAEDQIRFVVNPDPRIIGQSVWDIAGEFWEWTTFLPAMVEGGVVSPDLARKVDHVVDGARAIRDADNVAWSKEASNWFHTTEALRSDPLWAEVRHRAGEAIEGFRDLGLPIPTLSDPDFNRPREDAP
jgi:hypothetical protein